MQNLLDFLTRVHYRASRKRHVIGRGAVGEVIGYAKHIEKKSTPNEIQAYQLLKKNKNKHVPKYFFHDESVIKLENLRASSYVTFEQFLKKKHRDDEILQIGKSIYQAIVSICKDGVYWGDPRPANIMVRRNRTRSQTSGVEFDVKIIDFDRSSLCEPSYDPKKCALHLFWNLTGGWDENLVAHRDYPMDGMNGKTPQLLVNSLIELADDGVIPRDWLERGSAI